MSRSRVLVVAALVLMVPVAGMARKPRRKPQPKVPAPDAIVWRYCQLDLQGARLSERSSGSEELQSLLVTPDRARDAAKVIVSDDCEVGSIDKQASAATITVTYSNLGTLTSAGDLQPPTRRNEVVKFSLKKVGNNWKISGPTLLPHVSAEALRAHWQHKVDIASDDAARQNAEQVLDRLLQLAPAPGQAPPAVDVSTRQQSTSR